ncbi:MAG: DNA polymerase III subunit gamma/tau [Planctomycetota bacterium]|nr:DNA polymerase III subunit gamma/tau [Planctomycetota bacterium]MDA1251777.1 DNA polymerase III subunit gamma/tau [Planctomycetota bacterium]
MAEGAYTVMARRFRPQGFADVVGQEHISQALRNAIRSNRVAHAYLFTGARGVGKTSTARILAKALNCPQAVDGNPCNSCEICDGVAAGNDVDVLEIDGASNRRIDDIRDVRAKVNVRSMRSKYKIYIIDEVHMLTTEAFNALLKTLEEPPPNVKFVFCTTEPNKLPDTILSRCQRFDFGTIETASISNRLSQIAQAEGVEVDQDALELVARRAAGSMRDSQSIFDQLLAFGEEHIQAADVHRLLGTASDDRLIEIGAALVRRDQATALAAFHAALDDGVQVGELTDQLLFYLRDLMILATGAAKVELLSVAPASCDSLAPQAAEWGLSTIVAAMQILAETKGRMQRVTYGRALAELALVRIALLDDLTDVASLIEKLRRGEPATTLQKKSDVTPAPRPAPEKIDRGPSTGSVSNESPGPAATVNKPEAEPASVHRESAEEPATSQIKPEAALTGVEEVSSPKPEVETTDEPPPAQITVSAQANPPPATGTDPMEPAETHSEAADHPGPDPVSLAAPEADSTTSFAAAGRVEVAFAPENADRIWSQVVSEINDMLKSHVKTVSKAAISAPNCLELTFPRRYHFAKRFCEQPDALRRIEGIVSRLTGQHVRISLIVGEGPVESSPSQETPSSKSADRRGRDFKPEEDEFVAAIMETFSAQCVRVDPVAPRLTAPDDTAEEMDD